MITNSCLIMFFLYTMIFFIIVLCNPGKHSVSSRKLLHSFYEYQNQSNIIADIQPLLIQTYQKNRKLFVHGSCTNRDISISQSRDTATGIPEYIVQIVNTCVSGCAPSDIHLHCGWFASARLVNPTTFKRISYDDCLVNGGKPLKSSQIISFTYANSFSYPLSFKSAKFC